MSMIGVSDSSKAILEEMASVESTVVLKVVRYVWAGGALLALHRQQTPAPGCDVPVASMTTVPQALMFWSFPMSTARKNKKRQKSTSRGAS